MEQQTNKQGLSPASISAVVGGALVVAAVIALVSSNWGTFSSLTKVLTLGIPVVALYIAGFLTRNQDHFKEVSTISLVTASLAFPFVLGVAIFEMASAPAVDGSFIALVGGVSFLWFVIVEFLLKVRQISLLTYTSLASWVVATGSTLPNAPYFVDVSFIAIGMLTLMGVHLVLPGEAGKRQLQSYIVLGALSFFTTVFTLGTSVWEGVSSLAKYEAGPMAIDSIAIGAYFILGVLGIVIAVAAARQWKETGERIYGELRLVAEQSLLLLAAVPAFLIAFSHGVNDSVPQVLLALSIATLSLVFGTKLHLKQTVSTSWVLVGALIAQLLVTAFTAAEISWPVLVLAIGSLLFVLAFFLSSRQKNASPAAATPATPHHYPWGLGEPLPVLSQDAAPAVSEVVRADGSTVKFVQPQKNQAEHYLTAFILQGILFLIIVRVILPGVLGIS